MTDMTDTQGEFDEQQRWGVGREGRAARRLLDVVRRHEAELDQARVEIVALRQRVKALEDTSPPA